YERAARSGAGAEVARCSVLRSGPAWAEAGAMLPKMRAAETPPATIYLEIVENCRRIVFLASHQPSQTSHWRKRIRGPGRFASKPPLGKSVRPRDRLPENQGVDLARPFVREYRLQIIHVANNRIFERDAACAQDRTRLSRYRQRLANVVQLAEADVRRMRAPLVFHSSDVQRQQRPLAD